MIRGSPDAWPGAPKRAGPEPAGSGGPEAVSAGGSVLAFVCAAPPPDARHAVLRRATSSLFSSMPSQLMPSARRCCFSAPMDIREGSTPCSSRLACRNTSERSLSRVCVCVGGWGCGGASQRIYSSLRHLRQRACGRLVSLGGPLLGPGIGAGPRIVLGSAPCRKVSLRLEPRLPQVGFLSGVLLKDWPRGGHRARGAAVRLLARVRVRVTLL